MEVKKSHKKKRFDGRWDKTYQEIRDRSVELCRPLRTEDYVVQPVVDVSPPKWHLGHTTWFFETFILIRHLRGYRLFHPEYHFVFNSYYESLGARVIRTDRGNLSRPTVEEIYSYREHVDHAMVRLLEQDPKPFMEALLLGLSHEQQHQELLLTDIKYILGHNPLFPAYSEKEIELAEPKNEKGYRHIRSGPAMIGHRGDGFCFDNELGRHKVYLMDFEISAPLVSNGEYLDFISSGGYQDFRHWHADGWDWVKKNNISAPLYWHYIDGHWFNYTLRGLAPVDWEQPVCHVSWYETSAFAAWSGKQQVGLGRKVGMDRKRLPALPGVQPRARTAWRIQRQIHGEPDGAARRLRGHPTLPFTTELPQFFSALAAMAVHRHQAL